MKLYFCEAIQINKLKEIDRESKQAGAELGQAQLN